DKARHDASPTGAAIHVTHKLLWSGGVRQHRRNRPTLAPMPSDGSCILRTCPPYASACRNAPVPHLFTITDTGRAQAAQRCVTQATGTEHRHASVNGNSSIWAPVAGQRPKSGIKAERLKVNPILCCVGVTAF